MQPFIDALASRVLVCDGAMGTMLYTRGVFINKSFDALNLTDPDLVARVHQEYVSAGADLVETNTFGANRIKLGSFGIAESLAAINAAGVAITRRVAADRAYVAGALGPLGLRIEPWGKISVDEARGYFREQAQALAAAGVDLFVLETFRDLNEMGAAIDAVRSVSDLPIVAQMTTEEDGSTLDGTPPERFAPEIERRGATVIGLNCAVGPAPMLETIERMAAVTTMTLSAQPNAGMPRDVEGRNIYLCSPEYMASYARRFVRHNVRIVGGCCGTTPEHIRQIKAAVGALAPGGKRPARSAVAGSTRLTVGPDPSASSGLPRATTSSDEPAERVEGVPREKKSRLARQMALGRFVTAVELRPPRGVDAGPAIERARALKIRGIDLVSIPDGRAGARLSALSLAVLVEQQAGIETLLHYSCRDRNLLGIESDLLGAHAMGLRNLLLLTGDPGRIGGYPDATAVFDVDSIGLTNVVARLNRGRDIGGQAIGSPTGFHFGVLVNPAMPILDEELRRFEYKVQAGAEFVVTRPVFNLRNFEQLLKRIETSRLPIVANVSVLESASHAEFLANEVPGLDVPGTIVDRMRAAETPERARAEGLAIAHELILGLKPMVAGLQLGMPARSDDVALVLLDDLR
ncbi:MAG: bifunctional homocysteine S-methyltransferase/methylenetetrahydrofolate reductase [Acidobacteria bacterium RIFCSPLOWO2_12_FULL_65_11]|nr:MAG: bifunctional homocysteine S-methyltransferase/methylenetetrahydrofolate reductase [Acidobacteria bacterium RIFCSPLOWO2_02_FULL_64_15]OFW33683.1 MAG: bifunctional homocysteine S-methyltransferase/methylenetetrahydrofolate reductase [Acidobacteria bacterium RIFCSPLOWO2_12_FULL_65_11]